MARARFYDRRRDRRKRVLAGALVVLVGGPLVGARAAVAAESVQPTFDDLEQKATPEETYGANAFSILTVQGGGGFWRPVRGVYRITTEPDVFFRALGRQDLARQYARRHGAGVLIHGLGYVAGIAGLGLLGWGWLEGKAVPAIIGGALLLGWPVLGYIGTEMQKPELPADDALDMAGRYNTALRAKLRLSSPRDDGTITAARRPAGPVLVPLLSSSGVGLALGGRF